jgi:pimeloyl-ACP methyl ester carboxylesterase
VTLPVRVGTATAPDGAVLGWRAEGEGPLALAACNGIGVASFFWRPLAARFSETGRCTFVTWDYRGHGASPAPERLNGLSIERCASDLWAVLEAVGVKRAALLGHAMGAQVILEAYRQRSGEVLALVPILGSAGAIFRGVRGGEVLENLARFAVDLGAENPELATRVLRTAIRLPGIWQGLRALGLLHPDLCPRESFEPYVEHLRSLDLRAYFALARDVLSYDATDLLDEVRVPTLVIAGERDLFAPVERSKEMASKIAGAELLVLREGTHAALLEQPELIFLKLEKFLDAHQIG